MIRRSPIPLLAVGFLLGVLVAVLAIPDRPAATVAAGAAGSSATLPDGSVAPGAAAATGGAAGGSGTGGAAGAAGSGGATAGGGGDAGGGIGTGGTPGDAGGASAPGVTADTISIGFGLPDIGAIAALGPGYDQGDPHAHVEAILAQLRASGRLPVNGRDIRPVYSSYNILSPEAQRATCETFGASGGIFAVIAIHDFGNGSECVAAEYGLPVLTSDGQVDAAYERAAPNLFTLQMSLGRHLRNFVSWADARGYLAGHRIGVYYPTDANLSVEVQRSLLAPLSTLGANVVAEVQTSEYTTGGPTDSTAVARFRAANVDIAILLVSPVAKTNFFLQAQVQGYRPRYLENDFAFSTTSTATKTYPGDYFDGNVGFTGMRFGQEAGGLPATPEAQSCIGIVAAAVGHEITESGREAEYIAANQACDEILVYLDALEAAGPAPTRAAFVAALETVQGRRLGIHGDVTWSASRHHGVDTYRDLVWRSSCACWQAQGDFQVVPLP